MVLDANLNLYIADYNNNVVRRSSADGIINTIAGNGSPLYTADGPALRIGFSPGAITVDSKGATLYIADDLAYRILKMDIASGMITAIAGTGVRAGLDSNDTGPGLSSSVGIVTGMAVESHGHIFFADFTNARIPKIDSKWNVSAAAGAGLVRLRASTGRPPSKG